MNDFVATGIFIAILLAVVSIPIIVLTIIIGFIALALYGKYASMKESSSTPITDAIVEDYEMWKCGYCGQINELEAEKCYWCGAKRESAK